MGTSVSILEGVKVRGRTEAYLPRPQKPLSPLFRHTTELRELGVESFLDQDGEESNPHSPEDVGLPNPRLSSNPSRIPPSRDRPPPRHSFVSPAFDSCPSRPTDLWTPGPPTSLLLQSVQAVQPTDESRTRGRSPSSSRSPPLRFFPVLEVSVG